MENEIMNKEKWIKLFQAIGLDDETIECWHKEFEKKYPEGHQSFLEWLRIPEAEIKFIRAFR